MIWHGYIVGYRKGKGRKKRMIDYKIITEVYPLCLIIFICSQEGLERGIAAHLPMRGGDKAGYVETTASLCGVDRMPI